MNLTLTQIQLRHHSRLKAEHWSKLETLLRMQGMLESERYHVGEALEAGDKNASEYIYEELVSREEKNNELFEGIFGLLEYKGGDRIAEVIELINEEVNKAIEESHTQLTIAA